MNRKNSLDIIVLGMLALTLLVMSGALAWEAASTAHEWYAEGTAEDSMLQVFSHLLLYSAGSIYGFAMLFHLLIPALTYKTRLQNHHR